MSHNAFDIIREIAPELTETQENRLTYELSVYLTKKNSELLWELVENWQRDHESDNAPDYVIGVERGLTIAARELGEE